jgi:hypothetical protein
VFALAEKGLLKYTGSHEENPTLDLPCREVFAGGQKRIEVAGPLLEDEAGAVSWGVLETLQLFVLRRGRIGNMYGKAANGVDHLSRHR